MEKLFDIKDKVIAITGGGGILCGTMAKALAEAGARIAVLIWLKPPQPKLLMKFCPVKARLSGSNVMCWIKIIWSPPARKSHPN